MSKKVENPLEEIVLDEPSGARRVVKVGLDKGGGDVVRLDEEGYRLSFDDSVENFRELTEKEVRALSFDNQRSYWMAYSAMKKKQEMETVGGAAVVGVLKPVSASATTRMKLEFVDPDFRKKWVERWIRPDEAHEMSYRGYVPMSKSELKFVFSSTPGDVPTIADGRGNVEMILYKISVEQKALWDAQEKEQSLGMLSKEKERLAGKLEEIADSVTPNRGEKVFIEPAENDGRVWHEEPR